MRVGEIDIAEDDVAGVVEGEAVPLEKLARDGAHQIRDRAVALEDDLGHIVHAHHGHGDGRRALAAEGVGRGIGEAVGRGLARGQRLEGAVRVVADRAVEVFRHAAECPIGVERGDGERVALVRVDVVGQHIDDDRRAVLRDHRGVVGTDRSVVGARDRHGHDLHIGFAGRLGDRALGHLDRIGLGEHHALAEERDRAVEHGEAPGDLAPVLLGAADAHGLIDLQIPDEALPERDGARGMRVDQVGIVEGQDRRIGGQQRVAGDLGILVDLGDAELGLGRVLVDHRGVVLADEGDRDGRGVGRAHGAVGHERGDVGDLDDIGVGRRLALGQPVEPGGRDLEAPWALAQHRVLGRRRLARIEAAARDLLARSDLGEPVRVAEIGVAEGDHARGRASTALEDLAGEHRLPGREQDRVVDAEHLDLDRGEGTRLHAVAHAVADRVDDALALGAVGEDLRRRGIDQLLRHPVEPDRPERRALVDLVEAEGGLGRAIEALGIDAEAERRAEERVEEIDRGAVGRHGAGPLGHGQVRVDGERRPVEERANLDRVAEERVGGLIRLEGEALDPRDLGELHQRGPARLDAGVEEDRAVLASAANHLERGGVDLYEILLVRAEDLIGRRIRDLDEILRERQHVGGETEPRAGGHDRVAAGEERAVAGQRVLVAQIGVERQPLDLVDVVDQRRLVARLGRREAALERADPGDLAAIPIGRAGEERARLRVEAKEDRLLPLPVGKTADGLKDDHLLRGRSHRHRIGHRLGSEDVVGVEDPERGHGPLPAQRPRSDRCQAVRRRSAARRSRIARRDRPGRRRVHRRCRPSPPRPP